MIKTENGHGLAPFYEEKLDNGFKTVFLPRKSPLKSAFLYVPSGSYPHEESINSVKLPFGTAFFLKEMILSDKTKDYLETKDSRSESFLDYSYTGYQVSTLEDLFQPLQVLLSKILTLDFTENDIEDYKRTHREAFLAREKDPVLVTQKDCLRLLYGNDPISHGLVPSLNETQSLHYSTLSRYLGKYYQAPSLTLFVSGPMAPGDVSQSVHQLRLPSPLTCYSQPLSRKAEPAQPLFSENVLTLPGQENCLSFGIRFEKRESLYQTYGLLLFSFYEILLPALVTDNPDFLDGLKERQAELVDATLEEGGEEAYLLLSFHALDTHALKSYLVDYFSAVDKQVTAASFKAILDRYHARSLAKLSLPNTALLEFSRVYPNGISYPSLLGQTLRLNYSTFRNFLTKANGFAKAVSSLSKDL
ncbi:MAG: hypothetical protein LKM30_06645 [Bacilli bacterium]|jgi:hypothetical protein|nr:hypothetical protein [Bacilli bacterium]